MVWFVLDLDLTLVDTHYNLHSQALDALLLLSGGGSHYMTLVSYNTRADEIVKQLNIEHFFDLVSFGRGKCKSIMIEGQAELLGLEAVDAIMFDDQDINVLDCIQAGISAYSVNAQTGLTTSLVLKVLESLTLPLCWIKLPSPKYVEGVASVIPNHRIRYTFKDLPCDGVLSIKVRHKASFGPASIAVWVRDALQKRELQSQSRGEIEGKEVAIAHGLISEALRLLEVGT